MARSSGAEPDDRRPSLRPELLSGRSLEPPPRRWREVLREHRGKVAAAIAVVLVAAGLLTGKVVAERSADRATAARAEELRELLEGASPEEFLAFNAGVRTPGSLAARVAEQDGFMSVDANAQRSFIRVQPSGWWAGFTERCLVAVVRDEGVAVTVPKTACVRVGAPAR
ncbi:MAG TPA: hypothetical protein VKZ55_00630 [Microthrixaceae bacterium]|jgi:hypothetical protein|nr:hypothetical protein [Microthrixaceae bacterium]